MANVTGKVWGDTSAIIQNALVELHKINVKAGFRCSEHLHEHKWNGFYVESGVLEIHVRKNNYELTDVTVLRAGDFTSVRPGEYHYFVCTEACSALELYWPELLSEDIKRKNTGGPMDSKVPTYEPKKYPADHVYTIGDDPRHVYATAAQFESMMFGSVSTNVAPNSGLGESLRKLVEPTDTIKCVSICKLGDNGKCVGCGRSLKEIEMAGLAAEKSKKKKE